MPAIETLRLISRHPLNQGNRCRAWSRFVRWQVRSRLFSGDHVLPWVNNTRLRVRRGETGLTGNLYCGLHEFNDMAFVLHSLREGDLFVDVGANAGSYTILAAGVCGAKVISLEPVPFTFSRLQGNIELNKIGELVSALNIGLSDRPGKLFFTRPLNCMNHVISESDATVDCLTVPVSTLDKVVGERKPHIVKIDVEGYESVVLSGASHVLADPSISAVILETNQCGSRYGFPEHTAQDILSGLEFFPVDYNPYTRRLVSKRECRNQVGNTIFVKDPDAMQSITKYAPAFRVIGYEV